MWDNGAVLLDSLLYEEWQFRLKLFRIREARTVMVVTQGANHTTVIMMVVVAVHLQLVLVRGI